MVDALTGISVLVVEDNEDNRELLVFCLEDQGASVKTAATAAGARALVSPAAGWVPSIVVSDITLPDGNGSDLIASFRADARLAAVPAIALTGSADREARARGLAAGFQKYLIKPVDLVDLVASVASLTAPSSGEARGPATVTATPVDLEAAIRALAEAKDARGVLRLLNGTTTHRYTSLLRFDGEALRSVWTFDRNAADGDWFPTDMLVADSYCRFVRGGGEFVTEDGSVDPRTEGFPGRDRHRAYCSVPVLRVDGTLFGSLCHYDERPTKVSPESVATLASAARVLSATLLDL